MKKGRRQEGEREKENRGETERGYQGKGVLPPSSHFKYCQLCDHQNESACVRKSQINQACLFKSVTTNLFRWCFLPSLSFLSFSPPFLSSRLSFPGSKWILKSSCKERHLQPPDTSLGSKYTKTAFAADLRPQTQFWCMYRVYAWNVSVSVVFVMLLLNEIHKSKQILFLNVSK